MVSRIVRVIWGVVCSTLILIGSASAQYSSSQIQQYKQLYEQYSQKEALSGMEFGQPQKQYAPVDEAQKSSRGAYSDQDRKTKDGAVVEFKPFGSNLFEGNFARSVEDGLNSDYIISPGDRIVVQTWGAIEVNDVATVDGQGNIFVPTVGPVQVAGIEKQLLTQRLRSAARKVYSDDFDIYTNLLTVNPVAVYVTGFVASPGRYAGIPSDSPLYFIDNAGGINPSMGSYRHIDVMRDGEAIAHIDLYDFILNGTLPQVQFQDGDTIVVRKRGDTVTLLGDVEEPTRIEFAKERFTGSDALAIVPEMVNATDITLRGMRKGHSVLETMPLHRFHKLYLEDGDEITVSAKPHGATMLIYIDGPTDSPETIAVKRNARLVDVLHHIKVDPDLVDVSAIHIRRQSVAVAQKDAILDSLHRLERSALLALSSTSGEASIRVQEAKLMTEFVERAKLIETLGRVVTQVDGVQQNMLLEPNDIIVLPQRTNIVQVGGEVFAPQAVVHDPKWRVRDYIKMAGGYSPRASQDKVVIMRANGEAIMGMDEKVLSGDQILVPPRVDSKLLQNAIDLTEIVYRMILSAGVILRLDN